MMDLPQRKKIRIDGYDYSSRGAYFITICVSDHHALLWDNNADIIDAGIPPLSQYGIVVEKSIRQISEHYQLVLVDKYCIMPDHVHLLVFILPDGGKHTITPEHQISTPCTATISTVVGSMKRWVSKQIGFPLWQKSFHDQILWSDQEYRNVWQYIHDNPLHFREDRFLE